MKSPSVRGAVLSVASMRRVFQLLLLIGVLAACTSGKAVPNPGTAGVAIEPDVSVPAPGNCVPDQILPVVTLVVAGESFSPTFGIGSSECATLGGRGYVAFDYDPILIDVSGPIEVVVNGEARVTLIWPVGEPFTKTSNGHWRSRAPKVGCTRLTITVVSPSGTSNEVLGADIRVGGAEVVCAQRGLGPTEPIDTSVSITEAPDTTVTKTKHGAAVTTTTTTLAPVATSATSAVGTTIATTLDTAAVSTSNP